MLSSPYPHAEGLMTVHPLSPKSILFALYKAANYVTQHEFLDRPGICESNGDKRCDFFNVQG